MAVISAHSNSPDLIKIVALNTISANSTFVITDNPWDGSVAALRTNEGYLVWTTPSIPISQGTVITFTTTNTGTWSQATSSVDIGSITVNGTFGLSVSGDQLFIFSGTWTTTPTNFIWGYSSDNSGFDYSGFGTGSQANTSDLPTSLTGYTTSFTTTYRTAYFANGSSSTSSVSISNTDKCAMIALITNNAKWYKTTSSSAVTPPTYSILFGTFISYSSNAYCSSGTASVTLSGTSGGTYSGSIGLSINSSGTINLAASTSGIRYAFYTYTKSGCSQTTFATIIVGSGTNASFSINTNPQCLSGNSFTFTNSSTSSLGLVNNLNGAGAASNISVALSNFSVNVPNGNTLLLRMYVFGGATNARYLYNKDLTISGTTSVASSVKWVLTSNATTTTNTGAGLTSNPERIGSGITDGGFDATYGHKLTSATTWPTNISTAHYEQFSLSVSGGTAFTFNGVTATQRISGGSGTINLLFLYSIDGGTTFNVLPFSSVASGSSTINSLNYNWSFGDATTSTSTNPTKSYSGANTYSVSLIATDGTCSDTSLQTVTVNPSTTITTHPSSSATNYCLNGTATALSVVATGSGLTYQWYSNTTNSNSGGTLISGATSSTYTPPTTSANTTYYYCIVTGSCGSFASNASGSITINSLPTVAANTGTTTVCVGSTTQFANTTVGGVWNSSNTSIATINSSGLVTGISAGTSIIKYIVTNVSGCSDSALTTITVNPSPTVTSQSSTTNTNYCINGSVDAISYNTSGASTFQWYSNTTNSNVGGTLISGAIYSTYTPSSSVSGTTYYYCVVSNGSCSTASPVSSAVVVYSTITTPTLTPTSACAGSTTTFTASGGTIF
ncbi:MAG: beta strand repeat-containing protein, partial [Chitinophagaceae bacterium]